VRKKHKPKSPPYLIEFADETDEHVKKLEAGERALVFDAVDAQLRYEPTRETKHRKKMRPNWLATYRLRIAGELRVYYDVDDGTRVVTIRGVGKKSGNHVLLGEKNMDLV